MAYLDPKDYTHLIYVIKLIKILTTGMGQRPGDVPILPHQPPLPLLQLADGVLALLGHDPVLAAGRPLAEVDAPRGRGHGFPGQRGHQVAAEERRVVCVETLCKQGEKK